MSTIKEEVSVLHNTAHLLQLDDEMEQDEYSSDDAPEVVSLNTSRAIASEKLSNEMKAIKM